MKETRNTKSEWPRGLKRQNQVDLVIVHSEIWSSIEGVGSNPTFDTHRFYYLFYTDFDLEIYPILISIMGIPISSIVIVSCENSAASAYF